MDKKKYNKQGEFKANMQGYLRPGEREYDIPDIPGVNTDFLTSINVKI